MSKVCQFFQYFSFLCLLQYFFCVIKYSDNSKFLKGICLMKIAFFKSKITPEIGAFLAGYCFDDKSNSIADDLFMDGLCVDDGERKVLIISFDLLGLDEWYIKEVRKKCAEILETDEANVLFSCTHTHSGPESRTVACIPEQLNVTYLENLKEQILQETKDLLAKDWIECTVSFYSMQCNENLNRRYVTVDNRASFMPHWKAMVPLCTQFRDDELSLLFFWKKNERGTTVPAYVIGNFAAHPLAGRTPGEGAFRISADFPGVFRDYLGYLGDKLGSAPGSVNFRNKEKSWKRLYFEVKLENGKRYFTFCGYDRYMSMFLNNISLRPSCYDCRFTTVNRQGDITLGDFWGIGRKYPERDDDKGISLIIVNTEKGERAYGEVEGKIDGFDADIDVAKAGQKTLSSPTGKNPLHEEFYRLYSEKGIKPAIEQVTSVPSAPKKAYYAIMRFGLDIVRKILKKGY